jgi:hypothetical protein
MPIDPVPIAGQLDDAIIVTLVLRHVLHRVGVPNPPALAWAAVFS